MESTRGLPAPPDDAVLDEPVGTRTEQMPGGGANVSQRQAAAYLTGVEAGLRDAQVMLFIDAFGYAWLIGFVCFGIHLLLVGHLILASGYAPTILSILLALAGLGYVVDSFANLLLANYDDHAQLFAAIVAVPSTVGELSFAVWLLSRGGKRLERDQVPAAVAR